MTCRNAPLKFVPTGLIVDRHDISVDGITVHARGASGSSYCPTCGLPSSFVHSRYLRTLGDFAAHGRRLRIRLGARRFRCLQASCERRIFTERFSRDIIDPYARRTSRLDALTHMIALLLGGRPGERLADRLAMPVSADTLLRLLRRRAAPTPSTVRVVGIDDFAWLKGQRYGTIVCDLRAAGFGGSLRVVTEWTTRRRRASRAGANRPDSITTLPSARTIARLLTSDRDCRSAEALRIRVAVETASPTIVAARVQTDEGDVRV